MLKEEILRQINVRDHFFAYQANLIFAYRPYCLPDSSEPTGGVEEEIRTLLDKVKLKRSVCKPAVIIYHPREDERRRRQNEFQNIWDKKSEKYFRSNADLERLGDKCLEIILKADINASPKYIATQVSKAIDDIMPLTEEMVKESSMRKHGLAGYGQLKAAFCDDLIQESTLLVSDLHWKKKEAPDYVCFIEELEPIVELVTKIRNIIEGGNT